jgi:hypothetical protein
MRYQPQHEVPATYLGEPVLSAKFLAKHLGRTEGVWRHEMRRDKLPSVRFGCHARTTPSMFASYLRNLAT